MDDKASLKDVNLAVVVAEDEYTIHQSVFDEGDDYLKTLIHQYEGTIRLKTGSGHIFYDLVHSLPDIPRYQEQKIQLCHKISDIVFPLAARLFAQAVSLKIAIASTAITLPTSIRDLAIYVAFDASDKLLYHCFLSHDHNTLEPERASISSGLSVLCEPFNYQYHQVKEDIDIHPTRAGSALPNRDWANRSKDLVTTPDEPPFMSPTASNKATEDRKHTTENAKIIKEETEKKDLTDATLLAAVVLEETAHHEKEKENLKQLAETNRSFQSLYLTNHHSSTSLTQEPIKTPAGEKMGEKTDKTMDPIVTSISSSPALSQLPISIPTRPLSPTNNQLIPPEPYTEEALPLQPLPTSVFSISEIHATSLSASLSNSPSQQNKVLLPESPPHQLPEPPPREATRIFPSQQPSVTNQNILQDTSSQQNDANQISTPPELSPIENKISKSTPGPKSTSASSFTEKASSSMDVEVEEEINPTNDQKNNPNPFKEDWQSHREEPSQSQTTSNIATHESRLSSDAYTAQPRRENVPAYQISNQRAQPYETSSPDIRTSTPFSIIHKKLSRSFSPQRLPMTSQSTSARLLVPALLPSDTLRPLSHLSGAAPSAQKYWRHKMALHQQQSPHLDPPQPDHTASLLPLGQMYKTNKKKHTPSPMPTPNPEDDGSI